MSIIDSRENKCESLSGRPSVCHCVGPADVLPNVMLRFSWPHVVNVKLGVMVVRIELYASMSLSVTLTLFQGHNGAKQ